MEDWKNVKSIGGPLFSPKTIAYMLKSHNFSRDTVPFNDLNMCRVTRGQVFCREKTPLMSFIFMPLGFY